MTIRADDFMQTFVHNIFKIMSSHVIVFNDLQYVYYLRFCNELVLWA